MGFLKYVLDIYSYKTCHYHRICFNELWTCWHRTKNK